jgi:hypothetical protein
MTRSHRKLVNREPGAGKLELEWNGMEWNGIGKGRTVGSQLEGVTTAGDDIARRVLLYSVGVIQRMGKFSKELG